MSAAFREAKERFEASKSADSIGSKPPPAGDRPWRVVAGLGPSPSALHCATVGATEAIEAINRTNARRWREHNAKAEKSASSNAPIRRSIRRRLQIP